MRRAKEGCDIPTARVTSKGQITIPNSVRDRLKLEPGDKVDFTIEAENRVVLRATRIDIRELKGLLQRRGIKPVSVEEMNRVVRERAVQSVLPPRSACGASTAT